MTPAAVVLQHVQDLIREGEALSATKFRVRTSSFSEETFVNVEGFTTWTGGCSVLNHMLGPGNPFDGPLQGCQRAPNTHVNLLTLLGTLKAAERAIRNGHIARVEDLARADVLGDLLEQAEHLRDLQYHLAAGVLCRAALEEHLRAWCIRVGCAPTKDRPTIEDFKQELKRANHIDGITTKYIDHMAAIGNACAHAKTFTPAQVDQLVDDLRRFMAQNAIPTPVTTTP